jgi:hypothetical protein
MCRAVTCKQCRKPTWAGCGAHIEQVLASVPAAQRCTCRDEAASAPPGWMASIRRLFGGS